MIGLIDATAVSADSVSTFEGVEVVASPPVTIIRRVVVPTTAPDILLQSSMGESKIVIQEAPAPIVRTRSVATQSSGSAPSAPAPAQSKSSGS